MVQDKPSVLKLRTEDGRDGWVKVRLKYIPIMMDLDPSESINNMGKLRVDVLDAADLPSADRNGKSDPYCKFELNGQEVYKTKVQKKTLSPAWNEFFEVNVPSRTGANFIVNVYDYDFADKPDFLGSTPLDLALLEPFKAFESRYVLDGKSGNIRLRMLFRPDYVTRTGQGSSTLSGTFATPGRIVTGVAGAPVKGGVAVAGAVGHGVSKGASFLRRGIFGSKKGEGSANGPFAGGIDSPLMEVDSSEMADEAAEPGEGPPPVTGRPLSGMAAPGLAMPEVTGAGGATESPGGRRNSSAHFRSRSIAASSTRSGGSTGGPRGMATFTVVGAADYPASTNLYVVLSQMLPKEKAIGKTKHYKSSTGQWTFDETFSAKCSSDAQFKIEAKGDHFLGGSDNLGEHVYFVDETGSGATKELKVGEGRVTIKSSFQPTESSGETSGGGTSRSHLRRSFLGKRDSRIGRELAASP